MSGAAPAGSMTLAEAQGKVDRWVNSFEEGYWPPLAILARLVEEVGELAREVNHQFGSKPKRPDEAETSLELEVGDILFVLITFANQHGVRLDAALTKVLEKYRARDTTRWTPKETSPSCPSP